MNIEVLGDDISYGNALTGTGRKLTLQRRYARKGYDESLDGGWDFITDAVKSTTTALKKVMSTDTGKTIVGASLVAVGQRMTPTDKANLQQIQNAVGLNPMPYQAVSQTPVDFGKPMSDKLPYIIIGGAVLIGALIMFGTRKHSAVVA